jgi:nicotinamide mononucleotide adenylyltransferase
MLDQQIPQAVRELAEKSDVTNRKMVYITFNGKEYEYNTETKEIVTVETVVVKKVTGFVPQSLAHISTERAPYWEADLQKKFKNKKK